jgi:phage terminase small subunit
MSTRRNRALTPRPRKLTPREHRFVAEYLVDFNGAAAARRAGYSQHPEASRVQAARLLTRASVSSALAEQFAQLQAATTLRAERVIEEISRCAFARPKAFVDEHGNARPLAELADEDAAALASWEIVTKNAAAGDGHTDRVLKVRLADKLQALELLARYLGLLQPEGADSTQVTVPVFVLPDGARVGTK